MDKVYYEVFISAETQEQADAIINSLIEKKLATGGQFLKSPARFLWQGKVVEMDYITITSFTIWDKKLDLIEDVKRTSSEDVPMIRFIAIETNPELSNWIDQTLA